MTRKPLFWIIFLLLSIAATFFAFHFFPKAFPLVNLDISMNRQQALAQARPGDNLVFEGLEHIPVQLFPSHSQVVLVSPLDVADFDVLVQLRARGYQVMVISPDPVSFELDYLEEKASVELAGRVLRMERDLLLKKLQGTGVQILDWNVAHPFDKVIKRRLGPPPPLLRAIGARV